MFRRSMQKELENAANDFPIVKLLGPRQSGKTTLVREVFPNKHYLNMESLHLRELAKSQLLIKLRQGNQGVSP